MLQIWLHLETLVYQALSLPVFDKYPIAGDTEDSLERIIELHRL